MLTGQTPLFSALIAAILICAVPSDAFAQVLCFRDTDLDEDCWSCPGYSFCVCAQPNGACPTYVQFCFSANIIASGFQEISAVDPQPCYRFRGCEPTMGQTCTPVSNECRQFGSWTDVGTWDNASVGSLCGP